jgi:universal stress protein A
MDPIKTILCPTDFSEASEPALRMAIDVAKRLGSRIDLVHVIAPPIYVGWEDSPVGLAASAQLLGEARDRTRDHLAEVARKYSGAGVAIETHIHEGTPHLVIAELSKQVDLIVMGTHGRGPIAHMLLGSVAERVVRLCPVPVLTVH